MTVVFALLTGVIFRAGSLEAAWRIYEGLAILPDSDRIGRATPIIVAALCRVPVAGEPGHRGMAQRAAEDR